MLSGEVSRLRTKEIKTPLNIVQGQERVRGKRHFISGPCPHEDMALPFYKIYGGMDCEQKQTVFPQRTQQPQTIYVDGCKVTVRYAGKENPAAVREIKDILLSNVSKKS